MNGPLKLDCFFLTGKPFSNEQSMYSLMSMLSTHIVKMAPEAIGVVDERRHGFNGPIFAIIVWHSFLPEKKLSKKY